MNDREWRQRVYMRSQKELSLDKAIEKLADLFPYGHLQASVNPVAFLTTVCNEIVRLRGYIKDQPCECLDEYNEQKGVKCDRCIILEPEVESNDTNRE